MTLSRLKISCLLLISFFALHSCHKKDIVGPQGPQGPPGPAGTSSVLKGDIQGKVLLYDISGQIMADNSGATVSLEETSPLLQAVSATNGSFTIPSVHEGYFNLSVQKQGYGSMRYFNFANSGTVSASQTGPLELGQQMPAQYDIKQLKVDTGTFSNGQGYLTFTVILAHSQKVTNPVIIYFNDSTGVGNFKNKSAIWAGFFQQDDTTLVYSPYDNKLSDASDKLSRADYIYLSVAIDNAKHLSYKDENGNQVYPDAGKPSPEVIVNNVLHKY